MTETCLPPVLGEGKEKQEDSDDAQVVSRSEGGNDKKKVE